LQVNLDQHDVKSAPGGRGMGMGMGGNSGLSRYQSFTVQVSNDNQNWSMLVDKSNNTVDDRHNYTELAEPVKARYVKLTNVFTPDSGKFAVKDLRIFGNPDVAKFAKVKKVTVVRDPEDRRNATLLWEPVKGADGYVVRYGIEPNKLYNNYMVYDANTLTIYSLNRDPEYYFEVEAFDSGTDYYRERTEQTLGRGAEIELAKSGGAQMGSMRGGGPVNRRMVVEGKNEYVFDSIVPGTYTLRHTFGPVLWKGDLTETDLKGSDTKPTKSEFLSYLGEGTKVLGQMEMKVIPGKEFGKIVVVFKYNKP
jgi:xylan 1,4-beta-xylosidase